MTLNPHTDLSLPDYKIEWQMLGFTKPNQDNLIVPAQSISDQNFKTLKEVNDFLADNLMKNPAVYGIGIIAGGDKAKEYIEIAVKDEKSSELVKRIISFIGTYPIQVVVRPQTVAQHKKSIGFDSTGSTNKNKIIFTSISVLLVIGTLVIIFK